MIQTKTKYIYYATLISLAGILLGSLSHLAYFFGTGEAEGVEVTQWVIALAMEVGLMALGFGLVVIKQQRKSELGLVIYLGLFVCISLIGNTYYSLAVNANNRNLLLKDLQHIDPLVIFRIVCSSSILPLLILVLTRLQSIFFMKWKAEEKALLAGATVDEFGNVIQTVKRPTTRKRKTEEKEEPKPEKQDQILAQDDAGKPLIVYKPNPAPTQEAAVEPVPKKKQKKQE